MERHLRKKAAILQFQIINCKFKIVQIAIYSYFFIKRCRNGNIWRKWSFSLTTQRMLTTHSTRYIKLKFLKLIDQYSFIINDLILDKLCIK